MSIWLVMQASDGRERSFALAKSRVIIGRESSCDLRVPIPTVSQRHCEIVLDGDRLRLQDLHSDQGTYHNGNRVQEAMLSHDDTLRIGPVTFVVRVHPETASNGHASDVVIQRHDGLSAKGGDVAMA